MPAKVEPTSLLPGLSPAAGKPLIARFDGGQLSSDGGLLALREVEQRLGLAERLAACIDDPRASERVRHGLADILRFRMLMIAAGYEDGNDADCLRHDPVFKLALNQLPDGAALCSQPTISRLENLPDLRALLRMARAMVGLYCGKRQPCNSPGTVQPLAVACQGRCAAIQRSTPPRPLSRDAEPASVKRTSPPP